MLSPSDYLTLALLVATAAILGWIVGSLLRRC